MRCAGSVQFPASLSGAMSSVMSFPLGGDGVIDNLFYYMCVHSRRGEEGGGAGEGIYALGT